MITYANSKVGQLIIPFDTVQGGKAYQPISLSSSSVLK
ncbi:hypothetical protein KKH3_28660 [Pectobacterium actinidiae]|nr:hypothetical protein KKH3_28660 [Pectobacterium actinidiae]